MSIKVLAIRTDFKHHGEYHGYKQILKGIKPTITLGINERDEEEKVPKLFRKYQWLFEFKARKYAPQVDVVHILYGEDYFRWSTRLFKKPIVATYHQPADTLVREVTSGDVRGTVGKITHMLNRGRFKKLAAAIVTNASQKEVLKRVMPEDRIHVVPLGINLDGLNARFEEGKPAAGSRPQIITVGHWLRDWPFYFDFVKQCPEWDFHIVNRNLADEFKEQCDKLEHVNYYQNASDDQVNDLLLNADMQFLPVTGLAGSNALIQGFALGCPLVVTRIGEDNEYNDSLPFVSTYELGDTVGCKEAITNLLRDSDERKTERQNQANAYAQGYSWQSVIDKTIDIYNKVLQ